MHTCIVHKPKLRCTCTSGNYTERQKKLITSSECHTLKSKASTWIIFGHRLGTCTHSSLISTSKAKAKFTSIKEEINAMKLQEVNFQKITETARLSGWEFEADKSRYGVYVTRHWNWMNSYWIRGAHSVSSFSIFEKWLFVI